MVVVQWKRQIFLLIDYQLTECLTNQVSNESIDYDLLTIVKIIASNLEHDLRELIKKLEDHVQIFLDGNKKFSEGKI